MSRTKFLSILAALAILPFAWWTISPLFIDRVVDEEFIYEIDESTGNQNDMVGTPQAVEVLATGTFVGADRLHSGSGTARIISVEGETVLRLEDFEVTNGPDLFVLLAENATPTDHENFGEYIELAELKGNIGNQTYTLPEGIDSAKYQSVIVYCKAFSVVFATATLNP